MWLFNNYQHGKYVQNIVGFAVKNASKPQVQEI